jgi:ankyrin repeat protein
MTSVCRNMRFATVALLVLQVTGCASPPLHKAVESGDVVAVKQALDGGANADGSTWHGRPIAIAVINDDLAMVKVLHESGGTIAPQQLNVAVQFNAKSTYRFLAENGANIDMCLFELGNPQSRAFLPPIGWALARSDIELVNSLLSLGAAVETDCVKYRLLGRNYRFSAILAAGIIGSPEIVESLLRNGANPNRLNTNRQTPISLAAEHGHYEAVRVLLANGAFHSYTTEIRQPIEYAIEAGHKDVVDLLAYAGAVRPQRNTPLATPDSSSNSFLEGVKLVSELYVIYLGARYSGYDSDYTSTLLGADNESRRSSLQRDGGGDSCRSDWDCSVTKICAKDRASRTGTCVRDATDSGRLTSSRRYGPSNRGYAPAGGCPSGYERDLVYGGCKR